METRPGWRLICRPYFTSKLGRRIYAIWYGKQAFCFWVRE